VLMSVSSIIVAVNAVLLKRLEDEVKTLRANAPRKGGASGRLSQALRDREIPCQRCWPQVLLPSSGRRALA